jgi:cysteinyl-tRNA synthetase
VYDYPHLGNLRSYVFADVLKRMFLYAGYEVMHIINVTDIGHLVGDGDNGDDKMTRALVREGKPFTLEAMREVAELYFGKFKEDLQLLNILPATQYPFASDHIKGDIEMLETLIAKGVTYTTSDGIYFDTSTFPTYGALVGTLSTDDEHSRVGVNVEKKNSKDFALWKFNNEIGYDAPFGKGFPGWHIECSVMSKSYLGKHFDIHTGGIDHIPVHHTNEIAQSESANGEKYVNYWLHNNFLNDTTGKMAKSKGDFLRLQSVIDEGISPLAYRYFLLTAHYRSEVSFSFETLRAAEGAYNKLVQFAAEHKTTNGTVNAGYKTLFGEAVYNDLGTPQGIAIIWKMLKDEALSKEDIYATLITFDEVLGLGLKNASKEVVIIPALVQELVDKRAVARDARNWVETDRLRDEIEHYGFKVKDTPEGQVLDRK